VLLWTDLELIDDGYSTCFVRKVRKEGFAQVLNSTPWLDVL
jgi:hypothetical protein